MPTTPLADANMPLLHWTWNSGRKITGRVSPSAAAVLVLKATPAYISLLPSGIINSVVFSASAGPDAASSKNNGDSLFMYSLKTEAHAQGETIHIGGKAFVLEFIGALPFQLQRHVFADQVGRAHAQVQAGLVGRFARRRILAADIELHAPLRDTGLAEQGPVLAQLPRAPRRQISRADAGLELVAGAEIETGRVAVGAKAGFQRPHRRQIISREQTQWRRLLGRAVLRQHAVLGKFDIAVGPAADRGADIHAFGMRHRACGKSDQGTAYYLFHVRIPG